MQTRIQLGACVMIIRSILTTRASSSKENWNHTGMKPNKRIDLEQACYNQLCYNHVKSPVLLEESVALFVWLSFWAPKTELASRNIEKTPKYIKYANTTIKSDNKNYTQYNIQR